MYSWKMNEQFFRYDKKTQRVGESSNIKATGSSFKFFLNVNHEHCRSMLYLKNFFFSLQTHHCFSNSFSDSRAATPYWLEAAGFDNSAGSLWSENILRLQISDLDFCLISLDFSVASETIAESWTSSDIHLIIKFENQTRSWFSELCGFRFD